MNKMFKFGCVTFAVIDDVTISITCSTPKSMDILGIYLADFHGSGRSVLGVWAGDGKGMVRWVVCQGWGWWSIIIIVISVVANIFNSVTMGERGGIS
jgi:hypothetical protein